jgi:transposase
MDAPTRNGIDVPKWICHTPLTEEGVTMKITTIGIDLAKSVFQIHGVDGHGKTLLKKQIKRSEMAMFFSNIPPCLIGMEACGGAHYWARKLRCTVNSGHSCFKRRVVVC